jgi:hypothetical protein
MSGAYALTRLYVGPTPIDIGVSFVINNKEDGWDVVLTLVLPTRTEHLGIPKIRVGFFEF